MFQANQTILMVIIPLVGGIMSFLLPKKLAWGFALVITAISFILSLHFLNLTFNGDVFYYNLGGWSKEIGIEYKVSKLGSIFLCLTSFISLLNHLGSKSLLENEINTNKFSLFFGLNLVSLASLLGVCISNDIFNIYVLLEVNALSSYALVASGSSKTSTKAAFDYLIFGTIGSTFILFGIGFIYSICGTVNLTLISKFMPMFLESNAIKAGVLLIMFGFLMKAALFPISSWLVDVYQGAPSFVSSSLSSISNKIGIYLIINFYFYIFKINEAQLAYNELYLSLIAFISIITAGYLALKQSNIKRFLAYSSLSQIGFIIFTLIIGSKQAISGAIIYSFTHALEKTTLFLAAGYLIFLFKSEDLESFSGIAKKYPLISAVILFNLLSTVGFPITAGFVGKWQIFKASLETDIWFVFMLMFASLFTFAYAFKYAELLIFEKSEVKTKTKINYNVTLLLITFSTILNLFIGINSQFLLAIW